MIYDSRDDTITHIGQVQKFLSQINHDIGERMSAHDRSKLEEPEKTTFDEFTPKLRDSTYGSPEYKEFLAQMGTALEHHYVHNDHHPEHVPNGIEDMDLTQITEMLCDWKAATLRHADGDLARSINQNAERFGYGDEIKRLLMNTAKRFGWL
jgi:hypothetical protein